MTNLEKYQLSLFERCEEGIISEEERDVLLEATRYTKEFDKNKQPILNKRREIETIKDKKVDELNKKRQILKDSKYVSKIPKFIKNKIYDKKFSKVTAEYNNKKNNADTYFSDTLNLGSGSSNERGKKISKLMKNMKYTKDDIDIKDELSRAKRAKDTLKETLGIK